MKKILLLGAGYANMGLLTSINKEVFSQAEWILVNDNPYHYKTISLHDVASGKHDKSVLFPLQECLPHNISFIEDKITHIDGRAAYGKGEYSYDYLVVGLGFSSDSFGIKGVAEHTSSITSYNSAKAISSQITDRLHGYISTRDKNDLSFIVCGGGFTGIEFVGSLAQELRLQCSNLGIPFSDVSISCIEAMPKILPMFSENLMQLSLKKLADLGVQVLVSSKILECKEGVVIVEQNGTQKEIRGNTIIWTAGVKGNDVIANSPFFKSGRNKVEINEYLQPINQENEMPNVFVIGDCSALKDEASGRFYPPTAQLAKQQGEHLAKILEIILDSKDSTPTLPKFSFESKGSICSIGAGYAVGMTGQKELSGFSASAIKWCVESAWNYQLGGLGAIFKGD